MYVLNALLVDWDTSYAQKYLQGHTGLTSIYKNKGKCFGGVVTLSWHRYIYGGARQFAEKHFADTTIGSIRLLVDAQFRGV